MRRPGFQNGTMVPPQKPEQKTPFIDKLKNLKEVSPFLMPRSKVSILKMYMDEALKDGEITQEQHTEMLMPYFGELGENVTEQIEVSDRENFYAGSSLEDFGLQIKESYLAGKSIPKINEELGFKNDRSTTINSFIKSMQSGEAPITITEEEFSARPVVKQGRGQAGEAKTRLKTFIETFEKENNRLPSSQELRRLGNFDFYTIKNAVDAGDVNILDSTTARAMPQQAITNEQLLNLSKDKDINNIFKSGKTTIGDIKKVKKVIGNVSDSVAADRLLQLASIYSETGSEDNRGLDIKPKFKDNAAKILKNSPYTGYIRNMNEALIGKSVGDPSIKGTKSSITESPDYKQTGISKTYDIDEPLGVASSVNRGSAPYGIYGQIIDTSKNKMKVGWDARKSQLELELQEAIQSKDKKQINDAVKKFNKEARAAENLFNKDRRKGSKKIIIPEVSLDKPSKTNANYKNLNDNYKKAFNEVYANQRYSFKIPSDLKPITEMKENLKDPKILAKVEKAAKLGDGRIYSKIPGLSDLFEMAKDIPGDLKRAKYLSAGLKTLGVAATPLVAYDTYKAFKEGKPIAEALEQGFIGTDLIGSTKDLMALSPEGREARSVVKQEEMREQITDDFSSLDTDFDTPNVKSEMSRSEAERKWENEKVAIGRKRAAEEKAIANARAVSIEGLKNLMLGQRFQPEQIPQQLLAVGGRVGYADGPDDPSKRKFIKLGAGLMSLPIIGKYLKFAAPVAEKTTEIIRRGADGIPDFIMDLIAKVKLKAEEKGMKYFTGNRSDEFADVYQADDFVVTQRGNNITVKKRKQEGDMLEKDMEMEIDTDPETGGVTYNEATARPDAEGKLKDVEEFIDDIDLEDMRKYTYDD
jgi:hypothetical protein